MIAKYRGDIFQKPAVIVLSAMICTALWGSAGPFIKLAYQFLAIPINNNLDKSLLAGIRFTLSGIVVLVLSLLRRRTIQSPPRRLLPQLFMLGLTQTTLQYTFSFIGFSYTTGTKGTLFSSISCFFVVLLSPLLYKNVHIGRNKVLGCLFGLVGLLTVTIGPDLSQLFIFTPTGEGFLAISSFCFAISFFFSKSITEEYDPILTGGWQMLIGGSLQMVVSFLLGGRLTFNAKGLLVVGYLIVLSCLAVTIWSILLKYNDPSQIAVFHLLTPIFGTLFSSVVLHEKTFNVQNLAALGMVCFGIFLVNFSKSKISPYI